MAIATWLSLRQGMKEKRTLMWAIWSLTHKERGSDSSQGKFFWEQYVRMTWMSRTSTSTSWQTRRQGAGSLRRAKCAPEKGQARQSKECKTRHLVMRSFGEADQYRSLGTERMLPAPLKPNEANTPNLTQCGNTAIPLLL